MYIQYNLCTFETEYIIDEKKIYANDIIEMVATSAREPGSSSQNWDATFHYS